MVKAIKYIQIKSNIFQSTKTSYKHIIDTHRKTQSWDIELCESSYRSTLNI